MSRTLRPYLPGVPFHIFSRVAFGTRVLEGDHVKSSMCDFLAEALEVSDASAIAFCLMDNHFHLVVKQGIAPLSQLMRPFLVRTAKLVQKLHGTKGRVFSGPYFSIPCMNPYYLREVIIYNHLNPCRAAITEKPEDYRWSSHRLYAGASEEMKLATLLTREYAVFAESNTSSGILDYKKYVDYRLKVDSANDWKSSGDLVRPDTRAGNLAWKDLYSKHFVRPNWRREIRRDLRDIALQIMETQFPGVSLDFVRKRHCSRTLCAARYEVVMAAHNAGHSGREIARFLNLSDARISQITAKAYGVRPLRRSMEVWVPTMAGSANS